MGIGISVVVSLSLFSFQAVGLLSYSWCPFLAGEELLGGRATAVV